MGHLIPGAIMLVGTVTLLLLGLHLLLLQHRRKRTVLKDREVAAHLRQVLTMKSDSYTLTETLFHLTGGRGEVMSALDLRTGALHWWLRTPEKEILDPAILFPKKIQMQPKTPMETLHRQGYTVGLFSLRPSVACLRLLGRVVVHYSRIGLTHDLPSHPNGPGNDTR